jgi:peptidoglycan/xylan/chitin deacetylase (PgdA/CDA1 family)
MKIPAFAAALILLAPSASLPQEALLPQQKTVAITVDDLPYAGGSLQASPQLAEEVNKAILDGLKRKHAPATGFVIEQTVQSLQPVGAKLLADWVSAGFDLGNHTFSHAGLNQLSADAFEMDTLKGENTFVPLMKKAGRGDTLFLRFPYNATGNTREKHDAVAVFLAEHGYREAPCTIDNEDYVFNDVYGQMLDRHDAAAAAKLREAYLAYTSEEIDFYARLHKAVLGYEPPHIMLMHDNRLNADTIDQVLQLFVDKGYRFVSLAQAESDPVYKAPDTYVTQYGMMWGYRWARERGVKLTGLHENEPPAWIGLYGKEPAGNKP